MVIDGQDRADDHDRSAAPGGAHSSGRSRRDEKASYDVEPRHRRPVEADPDTIAGGDRPEDR